MALRLVVCVRWRPPPTTDSVAEPGPAGTWSEVVRTLAERATALGGRIVGWQDGALSVDFALDGLQDAVDFLVEEPSGSNLSRGLAHGELEACVESHRIALCTGEVLRRASVLAEYARPGEALVTPDLVAATGGELLTTGPPKQREGREPIEALTLDLVHPLRSLLVEAVARIEEPAWRGAATAPADLVPEPGHVTLVRGAAGAGGTRCLEEIRRGHGEGLWVRPGRAGWPHDALAQALGIRGAARAEELEALLLERAPDLVLVDDADEVDADSLELLGNLGSQGRFGLVLRVAQTEDTAHGVPSEGLSWILQQGPPLVVHDLEPLSGAEAAALAQDATGGDLEAGELGAIEATGTQAPLQVMERLTTALDRGDWVWLERGVRRRFVVEPLDTSAEHSLATRLQLLAPRVRLVLEAAVVLGGEVRARDVTQLLDAALAGSLAAGVELPEGPLVADEVERRLAELVARRWLREAPCRLASATARRVVLTHMPFERLRALHAGAARLGIQGGGAGRAAAAMHSARIGRLAQARDLAKSAAPLVHELGCARSADVLLQLAREGDLRDVRGRRLLFFAGAESVSDSAEWTTVSSKSPLPPPLAPSLDGAAAPGQGPSQTPPASLDTERAEPTPTESDSWFPVHIAAALARRDPAPLQQLARQARGRQLPLFAERLEALARLVQGDTGDALGRLRRARERVNDAHPSERCRAELVLAIGLAAAGRAQEALLGALQALARAREARDEKGERACARFLAQLARGFGDEEEAAQWESLCAP